MKRTAILLLALLAFVVCPTGSFGAIQEVTDSDGNVTHYKYTDRNGSVVFTDSLAKIPEEYRKKNKLVRVGPPTRSKAPGETLATPETAPLPEAPALPQYQVKPDAVPSQGKSSGGYLWLIIAAAAVVAGAAGFAVYRRVSGGRKVPPRKQGSGGGCRARAQAPARDPGPAEWPRENPAPGEAGGSPQALSSDA